MDTVIERQFDSYMVRTNRPVAVGGADPVPAGARDGASRKDHNQASYQGDKQTPVESSGRLR